MFTRNNHIIIYDGQQSFELILFNMSVKKQVIQLEKHININFPEYNAKFYSNRRNFYIHMALDNSVFGYSNFKQLLEKIDLFVNEHLREKFSSNNFPKLIHSTKWKFDYIVCRKKIMAEKLDNQFIPKYIPSDLKWYERDGLDTRT